MKVKDVMSPNPITVESEAPTRTAAEQMRLHGIRHLPVVDQTGRVLGMITDRDLKHAAFIPALAEHFAWDARRLKSLRVRDIMSWSAITTTSEAPLANAGFIMFQRRIGSLPVVDDGKLVGILTETDVLKALCKTHPDTAAFDFLW